MRGVGMEVGLWQALVDPTHSIAGLLVENSGELVRLQPCAHAPGFATVWWRPLVASAAWVERLRVCDLWARKVVGFVGEDPAVYPGDRVRIQAGQWVTFVDLAPGHSRQLQVRRDDGEVGVVPWRNVEEIRRA